MAILCLRFDLRAPEFGAPAGDLYRACLDMAEWRDENGLDMVVLSEHHGAEDGYLPAPLTMAAAVAGRTRRIGINIAALLVPLYDPTRLAEQLAVLDLASGGRVGPMGSLVSHPLIGGLDPEVGWASLRLFAAEVLPQLGR